MTGHHPRPITVEVTVPTPEALHELSIFLQEFTRKHHHLAAAPHHTSFAAETGQPPVHHQLPGMPPVQHQVPQQAYQTPVTFDDIVKLQQHLITNRIIDTPGIVSIYQRAGINLEAGGVPPEKYSQLHAELSKLLLRTA